MGINNLGESKSSPISEIENLSGTKILQELPTNLGEICFDLDDYEVKSYISPENFLKKFDFIDEKKLQNLKRENVGENALEEIHKTYNFLHQKFLRHTMRLRESGFEVEDVLQAVIKRLYSQVVEAGEGERKLINGNVIGLSGYGDIFNFEVVPYYAFASTSVSLDEIEIPNKDGKNYTLREIESRMASKITDGSFFLPNSLGVSINILTEDKEGNPVIISQERNNTNVLTQRAPLVASASGAIDYNHLKDGTSLDVAGTAIGEEIQEELGISPHPTQLSSSELISEVKTQTDLIMQSSDKNKDFTKIKALGDVLGREAQNISQRELGLSSGVTIVPCLLTMEDGRRNPEIIFIGKTSKTLEEIQDSWKTAESKDESKSIRGITLFEIEKEIEKRKKGEKGEISNHFLMSYLGIMKKSEFLG